MNHNRTTGGDRDGRLSEVLADWLEAAEQGAPPDEGEYLRRYPEFAAELAECFADWKRFPRPGRSAARPLTAGDSTLPESGLLGDYRILREVGRGGMGVVYEAEQVSLGRRVALKVLPYAATLDPKQLQRFKNEAKAAASLKHEHIVPIYAVGCERGVHYYAMEFIEGQTLAQFIHGLHTGDDRPAVPNVPTQDYVPDATATPPVAALSTERSGPRQRTFYRRAAELIAAAADALEHAHGMGVVHRDIKPANLLLDAVGKVYVSDFGLARFRSDPGLTASGDLVGTLRYMAPEQVLARHGLADHRADIYALGATLYELLTGGPAVDAAERAAILRQIAFEEPTPPRKRDRLIPTELEIITMKCLTKNPAERYATAGELAEDLRRFCNDRPIAARRVGRVERLLRWARRNPLVAGLSAAVVVAVTLGLVGVFGQWQQAVAHEQQAKENAVQAQRNEQEANQQRDDAQKQRDEVRALNEKLQATQTQLRSTLYVAHMNLAKHAWDASGIGRVRQLLEQHRPKAGETDSRGFEWHYLDRLCHSALLTLKGHTGEINSVAYSPDGKRLASAAFDPATKEGAVKVWDAQTGQELLSLQRSGRGVAFSPDGKRLASAGKLWDAQTGQELLSLEGGYEWAVFSPDGKRLAGRSWDVGTVKLWDAQTGQEVLSLKHGTESAYGVAFSPDGKRLASGGGAGVKVWDTQTGQVLLSLNGISGSPQDLAFSPDGQRLASLARKATTKEALVKVWDAQSGRELLSFEHPRASSVSFSPDGQRLVSGSQAIIRIWDFQTGRTIRTLRGGGRIVVFSPDGQRLASSSVDNTVMVWDAHKDQESLTFPGAGEPSHAASETLTPDCRRLASAAWRNNTVTIRDVQTGKPILTLKGHTVPVFSVAFSPDGKRLASGGGGHWSPSGRSSIISREDRAELKVWDAQTGQELLNLPVSNCRVISSVAFSPDGKRLASGTDQSTIPSELKVWDAQTGQELLNLKGPISHWMGVRFSPDGKRLASASPDNTVKVWDAQTGQELLTIKSGGYSVGFSPDGKRLASASPDNTVKVWDALTGQELLSLHGHTDRVRSVAFSPDGTRLVSASNDQTVRIWDAQTGEELLALQRDGASRVVFFSPDGHRLASIGGNPNNVMIWNATPLPEKP